MLFKLIKLVFVMAILAVIGLTGYAYLGDMSARTSPQSTTVTLNAK